MILIDTVSFLGGLYYYYYLEHLEHIYIIREANTGAGFRDIFLFQKCIYHSGTNWNSWNKLPKVSGTKSAVFQLSGTAKKRVKERPPARLNSAGHKKPGIATGLPPLIAQLVRPNFIKPATAIRNANPVLIIGFPRNQHPGRSQHFYCRFEVEAL